MPLFWKSSWSKEKGRESEGIDMQQRATHWSQTAAEDSTLKKKGAFALPTKVPRRPGPSPLTFFLIFICLSFLLSLILMQLTHPAGNWCANTAGDWGRNLEVNISHWMIKMKTSYCLMKDVRGYSSVVEHLTADQEVPGSNPGAPCFPAFNQFGTALLETDVYNVK